MRGEMERIPNGLSANCDWRRLSLIWRTEMCYRGRSQVCPGRAHTLPSTDSVLRCGSRGRARGGTFSHPVSASDLYSSRVRGARECTRQAEDVQGPVLNSVARFMIMGKRRRWPLLNLGTIILLIAAFSDGTKLASARSASWERRGPSSLARG